MISFSETFQRASYILRNSQELKKESGIDFAKDLLNIFGAVTGMPGMHMYMYPEKKLPGELYNKIIAAIEKRAQGHPMGYVLGYQDFYKYRFIVNEHTLIPRVETEKLVELCLEIAADSTLHSPIPKCILDCGTGSGCIGLSLALELPVFWDILLSDIDDGALEIAKKNAAALLHGTCKKQRILFYKDECISKIVNNTLTLAAKPGIILANLPYVSPHHLHLCTIKCEPLISLCDNSSTGHKSISRLIKQCSALGYPHILLLECDPNQVDALVSYLFGVQYLSVQNYSDQFGIPRFLLARNYL